ARQQHAPVACAACDGRDARGSDQLCTTATQVITNATRNAQERTAWNTSHRLRILAQAGSATSATLVRAVRRLIPTLTATVVTSPRPHRPTASHGSTPTPTRLAHRISTPGRAAWPPA